MSSDRARFSLFLGAALACAAAAVVLIAPTSPALAQPAEPPPPPAALEEKIAEIKKAFAASQEKLRTFEWIQTTVVTHNGEEKKRKVEQCYYGEEGGLVKVPISESPSDDDHERGLRGRIHDRIRDQVKRYMHEAADVMREYLPPNPERIQACKDAGNASIHIMEEGAQAAIDFASYLNEGDRLSFVVDLTQNRPLSASVNTTMGDDQVPITMNVQFGAFPDGTIFTEQSTLTDEAENISVITTNSGYRPLQPQQP